MIISLLSDGELLRLEVTDDDDEELAEEEIFDV